MKMKYRTRYKIIFSNMDREIEDFLDSIKDFIEAENLKFGNLEISYNESDCTVVILHTRKSSNTDFRVLRAFIHGIAWF